jgi:hypothetical protein
MYLDTAIQPLTVSCFQQPGDKPRGPLLRGDIGSLDYRIGFLNLPESLAHHALHEPSPTDFILILCHLAIPGIHAMADV